MIQTITAPKLSRVIIFSRFICTVMCFARLTIVQEGFHMIRLYQRLQNQEPPSESDPGLTSASSRYEICKDMTRNKFNAKTSIKLLDKRELLRVLKKPEHSEILHHVFTRTLREDRFQRSFYEYKYTNEYRSIQFIAIDVDHSTDEPILSFPVTEHTFVCVIKSFDNKIVPLYVSKEYNLSSKSYRAGRFFFYRPLHPTAPNQYHVLLAEEPATAFDMFGHNVERLYLEIRKHNRSVSADSDPICKLVQLDLATNQHLRICKEIFASAYFENKVMFTRRPPSWDCFEREVLFETEEARREAAGRMYSENMISCEGRTKKSNRPIAYYVSRAYHSHEVFVYKVDRSTGNDKVYLEKLFININAVEEPLGFEDVE